MNEVSSFRIILTNHHTSHVYLTSNLSEYAAASYTSFPSWHELHFTAAP